MKDKSNQPDRSTQIIRTSWIGIAANVLLAAFKAGVGIVAIVMDTVNNLSDALSNVITIVGTNLSRRPAKLQHLVPGMQVVVVADRNYRE